MKNANDKPKFRGTRCEVCVGCGECLRAWGMAGDDVDGESGPTNWGDAFKAMDDGSAGAAPKIPAPPGVK